MYIKALLIAVLIGVVVMVSACGSLITAAANFPSRFSDQIATTDIDFGSDYGSKLDVYTPKDDTPTHPVIVFFYGGAWETGSKEGYLFAADAFTQKGYVVVIPDYVKYPKVKYPVWQEEAAKAVAWTHNNINKYKGDASNLFVAGHSAGAHIGAILATDGQYLAMVDGSRKWIKAFAGLAGPYDFTPDEPDYIAMFGPPERYPLMQVTNYIDGKQPPMLLLWGKKDTVVGEVNITKLKAALDKKGGEYKVKYYDGVDHIDIVAALTRIERGNAPVVEDVDAWFKAHYQP